VNLLPWPDSYLAAGSSSAVTALVRRCLAAARAGRLPGTLMVVGEPGLGREAVATEVAAALICRDPQPGCDCSSCRRVRRGMHPDLQIVDVEPGSTEIRIRQSQALVGGIDQVPYEGARRVVVVADCHTPPLNLEAASALLKALEEPPPHLTFLLLAANPLRVLPTIVSRAVQLRVPRPGPGESVALLARHHDCPPEEIGGILDRPGVDVALALCAAPAELAAAAAGAQRWAGPALGGEGLAVTSLASLARRSEVGLPLLVGALLDLAAAGAPEDAEPLLDAAAALLRAEQRRAVLKLDAEAVVAATLAAASRRAAPGPSG